MGLLWTTAVVQRLALPAFKTGGTGSIPGQGTKILHAMWHGQKKIALQANKDFYFWKYSIQ